ncbi:MAG: PEP-CTERM sorting domain-containing protein [Pirellulales bacterium]|nr:PEP-CTERM sorting domain-containing protein [Pirellulales bacterium]
MKLSQTCLAFVAVVSFTFVALFSPLASITYGQAISPGPVAPPTVPPGTVSAGAVIKTPPLADGQGHTVAIDVHNPGTSPIPNWAGVLVEMHIADAAEVDVDSVKLVTPPNVAPIGPAVPPPLSPPGFVYPFAGGPTAVSPFGPASNNAQSAPVIFTALNSNYQNSGTTLQPSANYPVMDIDLRAKNTNLPNSDVDITLKFADIYHFPGTTIVTSFFVPGGPNSVTTTQTKLVGGSRYFTWFQSGHAFVTSNIKSINDLHIAGVNGANFHLQNSANHSLPDAGPNTLPLIQVSNYFLALNPDPETGHWIHTIPIKWHTVQQKITKMFHKTGGPGFTVVTSVFLPGSHLYAAPFLATATIGIEHIPEPAAPLLLLAGLGSLGFGIRSRSRRRQLAK